VDKHLRVPAKIIKGHGVQQSCLVEGAIDPCTIVIIGASGDLTRRKVIPALFCLYSYGILPPNCSIVGCARTKMDTRHFRDITGQSLANTKYYDPRSWDLFARMLHYYPITYSKPDSFASLSNFLEDIEAERGSKGRLFYFAIPPALYETVARGLGVAGLAKFHKHDGWVRIVVEKPFGRDLTTARDLDRTLHKYFHEEQIFRIDHYLAKETVQNILMFRFANAIFEPIWNRRYIDHVKIGALETLGVEHRAGYYEQAGVLRDMFQNHMMQLLALTAMEPPAHFEPDRVRDEKVKVYRALRPFPVEDLESYLVLGQYGEGRIHGKPVVGYRQEPGVASTSLTPTFAAMKVFIDNWRWQGVPFYLSSGKRLASKLTQIEIVFKQVPHSMFRAILGEEIEANRLLLGIYPDERITLIFQTKNPGARLCLRSVEMDFHYHEGFEGPTLEAYEKVLLDCILGDQMLFWRQDGVEQCWSFLTPVLEACETCNDRAQRLNFYPAGSWGPDKSKTWLPVK